MKDADRQTRTYLMELFEQNGFHPRTDLGQNFLIDINLIEYIVNAAQLGKDDVVLEVGAGTGGMTTYLAMLAGAVVSVEIDTNMHKLAKAATEKLPNVTLLRTDALRNKNNLSPEVMAAVQKELAVSPKRRLKLVSNLPYSVATPVVSNLVASDLPWQAMIITIQWELALKMRARPGSDSYGALSVWLQAQAKVKTLKKLPPTVFWPRPKINSGIVRLLPDRRMQKRIGDREFFHDFIRRLFHHRRKHMRSVLVGMYRKQIDKATMDIVLAPFGFKEGVRAEELDVVTLVKLGRHLHRAIQGDFGPESDARAEAEALAEEQDHDIPDHEEAEEDGADDDIGEEATEPRTEDTADDSSDFDP